MAEQLRRPLMACATGDKSARAAELREAMLRAELVVLHGELTASRAAEAHAQAELVALRGRVARLEAEGVVTAETRDAELNAARADATAARRALETAHSAAEQARAAAARERRSLQAQLLMLSKQADARACRVADAHKRELARARAEATAAGAHARREAEEPRAGRTVAARQRLSTLETCPAGAISAAVVRGAAEREVTLGARHHPRTDLGSDDVMQSQSQDGVKEPVRTAEAEITSRAPTAKATDLRSPDVVQSQLQGEVNEPVGKAETWLAAQKAAGAQAAIETATDFCAQGVRQAELQVAASELAGQAAEVGSAVQKVSRAQAATATATDLCTQDVTQSQLRDGHNEVGQAAEVGSAVELAARPQVATVKGRTAYAGASTPPALPRPAQVAWLSVPNLADETEWERACLPAKPTQMEIAPAARPVLAHLSEEHSWERIGPPAKPFFRPGGMEDVPAARPVLATLRFSQAAPAALGYGGDREAFKRVSVPARDSVSTAVSGGSDASVIKGGARASDTGLDSDLRVEWMKRQLATKEMELAAECRISARDTVSIAISRTSDASVDKAGAQASDNPGGSDLRLEWMKRQLATGLTATDASSLAVGRASGARTILVDARASDADRCLEWMKRQLAIKELELDAAEAASAIGALRRLLRRRPAIAMAHALGMWRAALCGMVVAELRQQVATEGDRRREALAQVQRERWRYHELEAQLGEALRGVAEEAAGVALAPRAAERLVGR